MLKPVDPRPAFPKLEEAQLAFWGEHKVFEKSVAKEAPRGSFTFFEGPPTANGTPGLHHVLARAFKDAIPRYKTMQGFRVERKAGWDTHGLPVELQVEKKLGLKNKQEIENIVPGDKRASIIEFNKQCKESVWEYRDQWEKLTRRMGYWVDMEHPYITYENEYIESLWWILARIAELKDQQGQSMLYRGRKVVPYCYRCGTALSSHEVAQGYHKVIDRSLYVKFALHADQKIGDFTTDSQTYVVAWTTTAWTLPSNLALAVAPAVRYLVIKTAAGTLVLAKPVWEQASKNSVLSPLQEGAEVLTEVSGADLAGLQYQPIYNAESEKFQAKKAQEKPYRIITGDFVTTEDGTGVVHIAPSFGEDDMRVGQENGFTVYPMTVERDGTVTTGFAIPGEGEFVKKKDDQNRYKVDALIIADLMGRDQILGEQDYEHDYPFCWRCDTPLIYYAMPSWFIRMSQLSDTLVANNEKIGWVPAHIKEGRFGEWLRGVKDWALSRDRYWGTPLPIWECTKCENRVVIDSQAELHKRSGKTLDDLHKPYIDEVTFACEQCKGTMQRTPEVVDVWFDSGAMPLAQYHYPFDSEAKQKIEAGERFPADFISEAIDQTRGWFYTLHALATLLHQAGIVKEGIAYRNVICLAHILDGQGKKMSKSRGNIVNPFELMDQYGADAVRWLFFTINPPGIPKRFDEKVMRDVQNRFFRMLWNSYSFFVLYAGNDKFVPKHELPQTNNLLDRWILSSINLLTKEVRAKLDVYDVYGAATTIERFVDDLSNWYIRRNRKRFWKNEDDNDKQAAYQTLYIVLRDLTKLLAPFIPFLTEEMYRNLTDEESVHLALYPDVDEAAIDTDLNEQMHLLREVVSVGLQKRAESKQKVRQPLASITLNKKYQALMENTERSSAYKEILCEELNVKQVALQNEQTDDVVLDTTLTPELQQEGLARDLVRAVQQLRKDAKLAVSDRIVLAIAQDEPQILAVVKNFGSYIQNETLAVDLVSSLDAPLHSSTEKIGSLKVQLALRKA